MFLGMGIETQTKRGQTTSLPITKDVIKQDSSQESLQACQGVQFCVPSYQVHHNDVDAGTSIPLVIPPVSSFSFPERTILKQDQIDFCISQFKACITQLVLQNRTPFIHQNTYQEVVPEIYLDLVGVCAIYCQKTPQNQRVIFSMLDSRVRNLVDPSKTSSWLTKDYLAGVQALIVYQFMRLFDGDIRQRANAERHMTLLETWTIQLQSANHLFVHDKDPSSLYEHWIFNESIRRTILMSVMLQTMYSLVKDGFCTSVPLLSILPLSRDGSLWNAPEEVWWQATLGSGSELLTYGDFVTEWGGGKEFHTDAFETILLVACRHNLRRPPLALL
jgi:hypothetical protein